MYLLRLLLPKSQKTSGSQLQPQSSKLKAFVLEPILTPSGLVDSLDDDLSFLSPDQLDEVPILLEDQPELETLLSQDFHELEEGPDLPLDTNFAAVDVDDFAAGLDSGYFTVGESGQVEIDFLFDGGAYQGELAIFSLDGMEAFEPGSEDFIQEAARRALSDSELGHVVIADRSEAARFSGTLGEGKDWNQGNYQGVKTVAMSPGDEFGIMLVPNSTVQRVHDNPGIGGAARPLFSMATANPDDAFHVGQIADINGTGNTFIMEDQRVDGSTDLDYNDIIFQIKGATGEATSVEDLAGTELDWFDTAVGRQILDHATPPPADYVAPTPPVLKESVVDTLESGLTELVELQDLVQDQEGLLQDLRDDLADGVASPDHETLVTRFEAATEQVQNVLAETPEILDFLDRPDALEEAGLRPAGIEALQTVLHDPTFGELLGLPTSAGEALANPDSSLWDLNLINAQEASTLLPVTTIHPTVAFLDFAGGHGQAVTDVFEQVNGEADYETLAISNGNWADRLIEFVDNLQSSGRDHGIANLSFDLSQVDEAGQITTRYELTPAEQTALQYAQAHNVLLVVAAGNTGDRMSALGAAATDYDNIVSVGAVDRWENQAAYSAGGQGLTLVAPGGEFRHDPDAFVGTSRATSYVTGAASLIWAANPALNYQQIKDLLIGTATDLGVEGWDEETGAGLLDVKAAVNQAVVTDPLPLIPIVSVDIDPFSGAGRVNATERPASAATEAAIDQLVERQNNLIDQWTALWQLRDQQLGDGQLGNRQLDNGNGQRVFADLAQQVQRNRTEALDTYQDLSKTAAITTAQAEQITTALNQATEHYQIEQSRLQQFQQQQQQLLDTLAALTQQQNNLEQFSEAQKADLEARIAATQEAFVAALGKEDYLIVDPATLLGDPATIVAAAAEQIRLAETYEEQAVAYRVQEQEANAKAQYHDERSRSWGVVGYDRGICGRKNPVYGWVNDAEQVKLRNQAQWQAQIAAQNAQVLEQLVHQTRQQATTLTDYSQLVEQSNLEFANSSGTDTDTGEIVRLLQAQAENQEQLAQQYWQQVEAAEQRRVQNQQRANWHQAQSRRWEVVGKRGGGFCGKSKDIYGWVNYPEHLPLASQAQQEANTAGAEIAALQQQAQQAQQEAQDLRQEADRLATRFNEDWPEIERGIAREIAARRTQLQAEQDLLSLTTLKNQQDLEALALEVALAETELQTLAGDRLPAQQQVVAALETRLTAAQDQWQEIQTAHDNGQQALQRFLESSGHFLPDRERLTAITTTLAQLDQESERLHTSLTSLAQLVANFPNPILEAQIDQAQTYVDRLNQDRQWLQIQRDSFQLASPNSPERLAIAALLKDLRSYQDQVPDSLPLNRYLDFLEQVEDYSTNLLTGFDDLAPRLAQAQTEATEGQSALEALQEAYRALGLEKSAIAAGSFLPDLVAQTQATSTEQQAILQGYETQIADAYGVAEQLEQQRQQHQAAADHWQGQIHQWEVVGHQKSGKNTVPVYDWVYHPEAEAQRDLELAAAATAAQQRDEATQQAQALEASLLPAIATTQATIASLTEKATVLHQAAQSPDPVPQQLLTNETAIGEALAAIAQTEVTIATLKDQINTAEATLSHKQDEIGQREQTIATTETEIAHTQAQIAVTQAEIDRQQTILNHQAQATALIAQAEEYEQLARNLAGEGSLRSVFLFITYSQQATQLRQQAQNHLQQAAALEAPGDVVSQDQIDHLQQTKQALVVQQEVLQTQVEQHQQALQDLHQDRADLNQQVTHFQAQVGTQTEVLAQQEAELHQLEQTRRILQEAQAHQQQLLVAMDQRLQDKYQAIQLTERFLQEVDGEIDRLHSRLDLLNQADRLQEEFEAQQNVWEATIQNQQQAVQALQALRAQGEADRQRYRILQEQLVQRHTQLASQEARKAQLEPQVQQLEQALEVTALQLETQRIKRDELLDNDAPLQSAEAHFLAQAEIYRQQLWFRKNGVWTYNSDAAENYRHALQNASLMADERNQLWPDLEATHQRIGELDTQHQDQAASLAPLHQELQTVEAAIVPIQQEVDHLQTEIAPIIARLAPLAQQEAGHHQTFVAASNITRTLAGDLAQTLGDQIQSLRRMVSFGVLASEADIDFFVGEVEPQVQTLLTQLEDRNADFDHQTTQLSTLVGEWQADLAVTTDDTSRLALEALISQTQGQLDQLARLKTTNSAAIADLTADLDRANQGLRSLRLSQELQVRQELSSNDRRLQSLEAQLQTEDAAETAVSQDSVVAYAQLADQVAQGLKTTAEFWTEDLLTGHGQTRELGQQQQQLSAAVDQLLAEIETQFADPHGDYQARETQLDQAITTHGVIAPRTDALEESVLATAQTIAQLEQSLGHDAALSAILAPVLARYNLEAQEVAAFEQQYQTLKQEDETLAHQYEHQRQQYQANADYWKDRIQQWEVVGSRKSGKKRVPVYGWVHHPEAEANYKAEQAKADAAAQQRDAALGLPTAKAYRQEFLTTAAANGTAIGALQAESQDKQQHYQPRYEEAKAKAAENTAVAVAALEAAHNYEQLAAQHLARSRRLGPDKQRATWTESRRVKYRGRSGKTKWKTVTITHVNHDWIAWNTYTKQAKDLRAEAATLLNEVDQYQFEIERWEPLTTQWTDTTQAANQAEPSIREARNLVDQLEAAQALIPDQQAKLGDEQALLPLLQDQLVVARQELAQSQDSIAQAWHDYDQAAVTYGQGVATVLSQRAGVERQAHTVQQELEAAEQWVEHQSVALADETIATTALLAQLQTRLDQVTGQVALGPDPELEAKQAQLDRAVKLLANKATVLTNQQAALTQKRALLTAQHEVILAEQRLLDAYLESPSADTSALQDQLKAARAALAEAQRLAEQAAASSAVLTAPLQDLQQELLSRNDAELTAAREKQDILDDLLAATQLNANYTLEAALKQQELNDLELQVLQRLQEATRAGSDEAAALWDVARNSSIAAAAEIYHKDYRDLASDRGGSCSGGLARPEDQQLADRYYGEWLNYQELTRRAQAQADSFAAVREAAEAELGILQTRQTDAAERLQTLNDLIVTTDEEITAKQEALAIAEAQLAEISRLRDQTEQTFLQLLTLEELNLAQAQLEVALAEDLKSDIDAAVAARQERELAELQRERVSAQVRLEQLRQIQSEDDLRQALNDVRRDVGLADVGEIVDRDALNAELALLLAGLREIRAENADLPPGLDTLMQETEADLLLALKGEEAEEINAKLLEVAEGLIDQVQQYKAAIADLEREEQEDEALLQQAEQDLQGATLKLFLQIQNGETLDAERELLTPLNLEVLQTVALADQAVEISEELANHSRDLLQQIIGRRKEERKQRNRAFWNETLGTLAMVLNLIGTILNFIPIPILKPIALAFKLAAGIIQGIISGINGDWVKAIYQITKSALNFLTNDLNVAGLNPDTLKLVKQLSEAADAAYGAYEAHKSGDNVLAVLRVFEGIADVAKIGTNNWKNADFAKTLLISLGQNAEEIYQVVQNAEEKDWIKTVEGLYGVITSIGGNFSDWRKAVNTEAGNIADSVLDANANQNQSGQEDRGLFDRLQDTIERAEGYIDDIEKHIKDKVGLDFDDFKNIYKTVDTIVDAHEDGGIDAWLGGIDEILGIWREDIQGVIDNSVFEEHVVELAEKHKTRPENLKVNPDGKIYKADFRGNLTYLGELNSDEKQVFFGDQNQAPISGSEGVNQTGNDNVGLGQLQTLTGRRILLDPGHGLTNRGNDPGAIGNGTDEATENLHQARLIADRLRQQGATVIILDEALSLAQIGQRAEGYDLFVSLHQNAFNGQAQGHEVYYHPSAPAENAQLAQSINNELDEVFPDAIIPDRGTKTANFSVLRNAPSDVPSVLVESLFIDAPGMSRANIERASEAVARGIENFLVP